MSKMGPTGLLKHIRFLKSADTHGLDRDKCWNWTGNKNSNGYGRFIVSNRFLLAHRVSYELFVGEIKSGMNVCHTCDNRLCVNPHHLWLGTQSENIKDAFAKGRHSFPDVRGEKNGNRKLTADAVRQIREMVASGQQQKITASMFGVSPTTIAEIIKGEIWKGV